MRFLYLPILLSIPLTLAAQDKRKDLSPALRNKLLAQNTATPPAATPAGVPPATSGSPAGVPVPAPTSATPTPTPPPAPAVPVPLPTGAAQPAGTAQPPGNTAQPPATNTPPRIPRPSGVPGPGNRNRTTFPGPGTNASPTAAPTGNAEEAPPADPNNRWGIIVFNDADITDVLEKYMEITHRHVLRPPDLQGKVTLIQNPDPLRPFSDEEAAEFIKAGLALQNFIIQRYNDTTDKIIMTTGGPPLMNGDKRGEPIYTREEDLPEDDTVVNYVLTFKHIPVNDASQILAVAVPVRQFAKYVAIPSSNALFVQEYTSNIRTLIRVTKGIDLPPIKMIHEWVELERASAEDVQTILDQILQAQNQGRTGGNTGGVRTISPAAAAANLGPGAPNMPISTAGANAGSGLMPDGSQMIIKADPRTNRVFLNGPEEHVKFLRTLIREFDEPSRVKNLLTQQLRYIPVNDFFPTAIASLEATGAGAAGSGGGGGGGGTQGGGARNTGGRSDFGNTGGGGGNFRQNFNSGSASSSQFGGSQTGGGGTGSRSSTNRTSSTGGASGGSGGAFEAPQAQTVGKTLLISDPRTNSLIVSGPPDSIQRVSDLVKEMDRRPFQVHINAVIAQMSIGDDMSSNVDIIKRAKTVDILGRPVDTAGFWRTGNTGSFIDPGDFSDLTKITGLSGFNFTAAVDGLFNAYVKLLETSNRSKLLAKPHITIANNEVGTISSGRRVPIPANSQSSIVAGGTNTVTSNVEYKNVVLSLDVRPLINSRNEITLEVTQLNDIVDGFQTISGNDIPIIATQELVTKVTVPNGAILVLGGLIQEADSKTNSGIPILSKIPVLKYLIGGNTKKKERRELVVLLQAQIVENADDMIDVNTSELQRTVIGPAAEKFAKPERNTDNVRLPTYEEPYSETTTRSTRRTTGKGK